MKTFTVAVIFGIFAVVAYAAPAADPEPSMGKEDKLEVGFYDPSFEHSAIENLRQKKSYGSPSYKAAAPAYSPPAPSYSAPAPSYSAPAPSYSAPAPSYSAPAPSYPASSSLSYSAPAPSIPCSKAIIVSCSPSVIPAPCSAPPASY